MTEENTVPETVDESVPTSSPETEGETTPAAKVGLTQTGEVFDALELIVNTTAKIMADGKVDLGDIQHLVGLATKLDVLVEAVKGADQLDDEFKDLDKEEAIILIMRAYDLVRAFTSVDRSKGKI